MTHESMTLLDCPAGVPHKVIALEGGRHFQLRLKNLGLSEGRLVTKVHSHLFGGPVTVKVQNTELALGCGMARRILVTPTE